MNNSRRQFLKNTGSIAAGSVLVPGLASGVAAQIQPSDTVMIALIGCRGMGLYNLKDHLKIPGVTCAAMCDVDANVLNEKAAEITKLTGKTPKLFKD